MVYSFTRISRYLRCPRSYRYRYLDGWTEKEAKANPIFGRCFETALAGYFRGDDCTEILFREWGAYLRAFITDEQREEYGPLVMETARQIEAGQFLPHSGIRFPMNGCTSCAHLGLCLGTQPLIDSKLVRQPGAADLDWLDQLEE